MTRTGVLIIAGLSYALYLSLVFRWLPLLWDRGATPEPLPSDHPDVQVRPAVTMQDMLAQMFGGDATDFEVLEIPVEESNPGTYL